MSLAAESPFNAALSTAVERLRAESDPAELAQQAITLALELTRSEEAAIGLGNLAGRYERFFSLSTKTQGPLAEDAIARLIRQGRDPAAAAVELRASGQVIGVVAVRRPAPYTDTERQALGVFAAALALALSGAEMRRRQLALETALIELRSKVDQQEAQQKATAERLRSAERVERAHELSVQVLTAVSSHAVSGLTLSDFYRRLARTVGELVGADKVVFWRLRDGSHVEPLAAGHGVSQAFLSRLGPAPCDPDSDELASRVVFKDVLFRANRQDQPSEFAYVLERLGVASAMSVPWRAGQERLGLLAAYDSVRPGGFSREDTWVLQKAGLAAGLVTQLWHTQEELRKSVDRLTKVDAARQLLLKNMTTVVDKERKRFVSELHDDALQKLTAAEMHVARLAPGAPANQSVIESISTLLQDTDAALRRLVFEVHPPSLDTPDGLERSISERVAMLSAAQIKPELELELPQGLNMDVKAMLFRQMSEALSNVERHSRASTVKVSLKQADGGIAGVVEDDGHGFDVSSRSNLPGHLGLQALKERTLMAGGRYNIESKPGSGTRVEFWIPHTE